MDSEKLTILGGVALGTGLEDDFLEGVQEKYDLDCIAWDNGTIDFGPHLLGGNQLYQPRENTKADLKKLMRIREEEDIPLIFSSAVGAGSRYHVDELASTIKEALEEGDFGETKIAKIYTDVDKDHLKQKISEDKISILDWDKQLTAEDVDESSNIVGAIGPNGFVEALEQGADIIAGGRGLDVSPFASIAIHHGLEKGNAVHMGKIMECGGLVSDIPVSSEPVVGFVTDDYFEVEPSNPEAKVSVTTVCKHHLYEKSDPYVIHTPELLIDLTDTNFEQVADNRVRVSGATYEEKDPPSILLEGAGHAGYQTIAVGGIRSPNVISQIDDVIREVEEHVREKTEIPEDDWQLIFKKYGIDAVPLFPIDPPSDEDPYEIGILIRAVGTTQEIANAICESARFRFFTKREYDPSGALASPVKQSTYPVGDGYKHTVHHLMDIDEPAETYDIEMEVVT